MKSYWKIPRNIGLDHQLTALSRLLYGEIYILSLKKGYCWASNEYFSKIFKVSVRTIIRSINELQQSNYIKCRYISYEQESFIKHRIIEINVK